MIFPCTDLDPRSISYSDLHLPDLKRHGKDESALFCVKITYQKLEGLYLLAIIWIVNTSGLSGEVNVDVVPSGK